MLLFGLGAEQGNIDAPLNWNAVFDILLDALAAVPSNFHFHDIDCLQKFTVDTDDLRRLLSVLQHLTSTTT